jgi:hypothetical protein
MDKPRGGKKRAGRSVRVSRVERERLLGAYRASGLTQEKFAAQSGIKVGTLRTWIYKRRTPAVAGNGSFAPVRIVEGSHPATNSRGAVTVRWPQGIEVEIAVDLDRAGVASLVRKLLGPCLR